MAIELLSKDQKVASPRDPVGRRIRVSDVLFDLLHEAGDVGLTPKAALELAAKRGMSLNRGSVYTLLNRMERAGTAFRENSHYRLSKQRPNGAALPVQ